MISFLINTELLDQLASQLEKAPQEFAQRLTEANTTIAGRWRKDLATYPAAPSYPINWDSERQRWAFRFTAGFGGGIPHVRAGALPDSWQVEIAAANSAALEAKVFTLEEWAKWIQDRNFQSRIHAGRWLTTQGELQETHAWVIEQIQQALGVATNMVAAQLNSLRGGD